MNGKPTERTLYRFWTVEPGHEDQEWIGWWSRWSDTWTALYRDGIWSAEFVTRWEPIDLPDTLEEAE